MTSGLQDFSLSRAKNEWGIRVPWDSTQTFYVWTDALMGYMTGQTEPFFGPLLTDPERSSNLSAAAR